jgi:hypothetical protein
MKKIMKFCASGIVALIIHAEATYAQKINEERMQRDIEVAENVLSTLIKQELNKQRTYFGIDVNGTYQEGYGVTFRIPGDNGPVALSAIAAGKGETYLYRDNDAPVITYSRGQADREQDQRDRPAREREEVKSREVQLEKKRVSLDSVREVYNQKMIKAAKDFIVDYGDFISQLGANERIIVTNQGENRGWYFHNDKFKRTHISVEGSKADIVAFKQGKMTRDQAIGKLKIVNTVTVETKETDLELLASIFNRLYRPDLSSTYFSQNNMYYERLKDYGVIYYMQVYSSEGSGEFRTMPTQGLTAVDEATRNKKVVELYPKFEQELKENILEYGRTLKTLKDEEVLVFNVTLTKCKGCAIPATLELTVKGSVLKDYGSGKADKNASLARISVKKGANQ